jgi:hypothetical protein
MFHLALSPVLASTVYRQSVSELDVPALRRCCYSSPALSLGRTKAVTDTPEAAYHSGVCEHVHGVLSLAKVVLRLDSPWVIYIDGMLYSGEASVCVGDGHTDLLLGVKVQE